MKKYSFGVMLLSVVLLLSLSLGACGSKANGGEPTYDFSDVSYPEDDSIIFREISKTVFYYIESEEVENSERISGYRLPKLVPTADEIKAIQDRGQALYSAAYLTKTPDIHYEYNSEYKNNSLEYSELKKYNVDELLWSVKLTDFRVSGFSVVDGGVIAYGDNWEYPMEESDGFMVKLDENGNILWQKTTDFGSAKEYIHDILQNDDGSYTVFGNGVVCQYSSAGDMMSINNVTNKYTPRNVKKYHDGYIFPDDSVTKLDQEGNPTERYTYKSQGVIYVPTDVMERNGLLYLSTYAFPESAVSELRHYVTENASLQTKTDVICARMRNYITAVLLTCDLASGEVLEFNEVEGALGGKISTNEAGELLWDVENITTAYYSPATSAFNFGGNCYVYRHRFDTKGNFVGAQKIDQITDFAW